MLYLRDLLFELSKYIGIDTTCHVVASGCMDLVNDDATLTQKISGMARILTRIPLTACVSHNDLRRRLKKGIELLESACHFLEKWQSKRLSVHHFIDLIAQVTFCCTDSIYVELLISAHKYFYLLEIDHKSSSANKGLHIDRLKSLSKHQAPSTTRYSLTTSVNLIRQPMIQLHRQDALLNLYRCAITNEPLIRPVAVQIKGKPTFYFCEASALHPYFGDFKTIQCLSTALIPGLNCKPTDLIIRGPLDRAYLKTINDRLLEMMKEDLTEEPKTHGFSFLISTLIMRVLKQQLQAYDSSMQKICLVASHKRMEETPPLTLRILSKIVSLSCDLGKRIIKIESKIFAYFFSKAAAALEYQYPDYHS